MIPETFGPRCVFSFEGRMNMASKIVRKSRGVDSFTAERFLAALPTVNGAKWEDVGLIGGECCFLLRFNDKSPGLLVRSSVRQDGKSAPKGEDSIRVLLVQNADNLNAAGVKIGNYTTRVNGWESRTAKIILEMVAWVNRSSSTCPLCNSSIPVLASKHPETLDRPFQRCESTGCKFFEWLDEAARDWSEKPRDNGNEKEEETALDKAQDKAPKCKCGTDSTARIVKKEGANTGRIFYNCGLKMSDGGCNFFAWADAVSIIPTVNGEDKELIQAREKEANGDCPKCHKKGSRKVWRVSKPGANCGRLFAKCGEKDCDSFDFLSEKIKEAGESEAKLLDSIANNAPACPKCGSSRRCFRVKKPGPNNGKLFLTCSDQLCKGGWEWVAVPQNGSARASGRGETIRESAGDSEALRAEEEAAAAMAPDCERCGSALTVGRKRSAGSRCGELYAKCSNEKCGNFLWLDEDFKGF
jgi:GRF zinc finger